MQGRIVQVNVSQGGLPKYAVWEAMATPLGLEGDAVAHPNIHGGPRQALLLVAGEAIAQLAAQGYPLSPGALGENLTIEGIDHRRFRAGQKFRAGQAMIELTRPRRPCSALDRFGDSIHQAIFDGQVKAGDPASPRWGLSGFYAAVLEPGLIRTGDPIVLLEEPA